MYIFRSNLDREFLKNLRALEKLHHVIILLEYSNNDCLAHCFDAGGCEKEFAVLKIGTRNDTKEKWYTTLSRKLSEARSRPE